MPSPTTSPSILSALLAFLVSASVCAQEATTDSTDDSTTGNEYYESGRYNDSSYAGHQGYPFYSDSSLGSGQQQEYYATFPEEDKPQLFQAQYAEDGEYRQPRSICFANPQLALVATKFGGQVYSLTWPGRKLNSAWQVEGAQWGHIVSLGTNRIAIAELEQSEIHLYELQGTQWLCVATLSAPGEPERLCWDNRRSTLMASGKWSQRLYRWRLDFETNPSIEASPREEVDLPMCGGQILPLPKRDVVLVFDAFGRHYVAIDRESFQVVHHASVYGHNISGVAATPDEEMVYFPHQLLNEIARSERTDITWGGLISNNMRWLQTERMLTESGEEIFKQGKFYPLGTPGNGAGDPSSLAVASDQRIAVTLAGTNRVTIGKKEDYYFKQVDVGYRPVDCAFSPDETHLVVVNQFSDSLTFVELETMTPEHLMLGDLREPTLAEQGEQLFFSAMLAHDRWMSCHSCHSQGHSNGILNDNKSDKSFGTPKRVLSLLGQAKTEPYAWGGHVASIADQVSHSITSTMAGPPASPRVVEALTTYVQSLPPAPSLVDARRETDRFQELIAQGGDVFRSQGCVDCHAGREFTSQESYDVGIHDERNMTKFNPPSLVGVSQRQNLLFHDGSADSLLDVIQTKQHQVNRPLDQDDAQALVTFLQSL